MLIQIVEHGREVLKRRFLISGIDCEQSTLTHDPFFLPLFHLEFGGSFHSEFICFSSPYTFPLLYSFLYVSVLRS